MRRALTLTDDERHALVAARDRDRRPYVRERAAALLLIADGQSPHAIARRGLLKPRHPDTVYAWLDAYERDGVAGLVQQPRGHRGFSPSAGRGVSRDGAAPPVAPRCGAHALAAD